MTSGPLALTLCRAPSYLAGARRVAAPREDLLTEQVAVRSPLTRISLRRRIGGKLLSAWDNSLFLGTRGISGLLFGVSNLREPE